MDNTNCDLRPGLRERFVFSQHQYCSNSFWKYFTENLFIVWPYEFRDCYKRNFETGKLSISTEFKTRIADLSSWTMCPDFFQRFPDLYTDIPANRSIPKQLYVNASATCQKFPSQNNYSIEEAEQRLEILANQRGAEQEDSFREYTDENWVENLSQLGSNSEKATFEENLELCLL